MRAPGGCGPVALWQHQQRCPWIVPARRAAAAAAGRVLAVGARTLALLTPASTTYRLQYCTTASEQAAPQCRVCIDCAAAPSRLRRYGLNYNYI